MMPAFDRQINNVVTLLTNINIVRENVNKNDRNHVKSSSSKMRRKSKSSNKFYNFSVNAICFTLITSRNLCLQKKERWRPPYSITLPWRQHR